MTNVAQGKKLFLGTRGSPLALAQAGMVAALLEKAHPGLAVARKIIKTTGDRFLRETFASLEVRQGKGLFTKELEEELQGGTIDLAIHSLKDLPTELPGGLVLGGVPGREDPHDVLVTGDGCPLGKLPAGAVVGTSSPRRRAQLAWWRRDLRFVECRGNVDTRLRKLAAGEARAIVLAEAGLARLGRREIRREPIPFEIMLPAVGQGLLGVECRGNDQPLLSWLAALSAPEAVAEAEAQRALLAGLGGGCQVPLGCVTRVEQGTLAITAVLLTPDGRKRVQAEERGPVAAAAGLGRTLAGRILAQFKPG